MPDHHSQHWLPPGWTVKVRVRDNGKKDKYYFSPSGDSNFNSRIKVSRYLSSSINTSHPETANNVVFDKSVVADLPAGCFKTITTIKNDSTDRRDMNVSKKSKFAVTRSSRQIIFGQSSNFHETKSDKTIDKSAREEECMLNTEFSILNLPKEEDALEIEAKITGSIVSMSEVGTPTDNPDVTMKDENRKIQKGKRKCKQIKETNLPRRTSKRLAAVGGDYPLPEPKKIMSVQGTASKCSEGAESNFNNVKSKLQSPESMSGKEKSMIAPELRADERVEDNGRSVCQGISLLLEEKPVTTEELVRNAEHGNTAEVKSEYCSVLPLREILSDPCIAFAVQTLTGVNLEAPTKSSNFCDPNNYKHPPEASTVNCYENKEGDAKQAHDIMPQGNLVFSKDRCGILDKNNENLESSYELPSLSWLDPCIEFAIKTLIGATPEDRDTDMQNYQELRTVDSPREF